MFKDKISVLFKNKNTILFITTVFYIFGLFAFFQNHPVTLSFIVTAILSFLLITNYISKKQALVWLLAFYFAFFNASFQTSNFSQLSSITPQNVVAKGRILSIPNNSYENKSKFFFEINELEYENNRLKNLKEKILDLLNELSV